MKYYSFFFYDVLGGFFFKKKNLLNYNKYNSDLSLFFKKTNNHLNKELSTLIRFNSFFDQKNLFLLKSQGSFYKLQSPLKLFFKFKVPLTIYNIIWEGFFDFFFNLNFFLFEKTILFLFDINRLDKHPSVFKFINKFFLSFPYHNSNSLSIYLRIKGKMSRKGVARSKTFHLKRFFSKNKVFSIKKYFFLVVVRTGCTCFLCAIKYKH